MPSPFTLAMVCTVAYAVVVTAMIFIHGAWLAPFIEQQGERSAGFSAWILRSSLFRDYLAARRLCSQLGITPLWLRWMTLLLPAASILIVCVMGLMLVGILVDIFAK